MSNTVANRRYVEQLEADMKKAKQEKTAAEAAMFAMVAEGIASKAVEQAVCVVMGVQRMREVSVAPMGGRGMWGLPHSSD